MHDWSITTKYYSTTVTLWLDEVTNPSAWVSDFLSDEAAEVITALGGWVYCFRKPATRDEFDAVKSNLAQFAAVSEKLDEGCCLAVALRQPVVPSLTIETDEWDDLCIDHGFEFVDLEASGETEFGGESFLLVALVFFFFFVSLFYGQFISIWKRAIIVYPQPPGFLFFVFDE